MDKLSFEVEFESWSRDCSGIDSNLRQLTTVRSSLQKDYNMPEYKQLKKI